MSDHWRTSLAQRDRPTVLRPGDKNKPVLSASSNDQLNRTTRRKHTKSRAGCHQCKTRRVKCDEGQPSCRRCGDFGVNCSYGPGATTDMHFAGEGSFVLEPPVKTTMEPFASMVMLGPLAKSTEPMPSLRNLQPKILSQKWMDAEMELFTKYQERTVYTIGAKTTGYIYRHDVLKLALQYPFLRHVVLTLTLLHDRHLTGLTTIGERASLHWYQGTAQFLEALDKPQQQAHRDALWASAAMLGCIQFAAIEARTPEEAWPLRASSTDDLDWLKMSEGKKAVWKICKAHRDESIFHKMKGHPDLYRPVYFTGHELANVTAEFCEVFNLGPSSSAEENPYHTAAFALARLLPLECDGNTILEFLGWMAQVHPKLKRLLLDKEPKALLLLACWYAKVYKFQWWIYRRGFLEGNAICIYLDRYYSHAKAIQSLLLYPKMQFGLAFKDSADRSSLLQTAYPTPPIADG